jgi:hypothetical protein
MAETTTPLYDPSSLAYNDNQNWRKMPFAIHLRADFDSWNESIYAAFGARSSRYNDNNASSKLFNIEHTTMDPQAMTRFIQHYLDDDAPDIDGDNTVLGKEDGYVDETTRAFQYDFRKQTEGRPSADFMPYSRMFLGSTEIGYNDTINCLPQFNHDDDIAHKRTTWFPDWGNSREITADYHPTENHWISMGRVYLETFHQTQSIMWICAGVPVYNSLLTYYTQAYNKDMSTFAQRGADANILTQLLRVAGSVLMFPFWPLKAFKFAFITLPAFIKGLVQNTPISKYFEFKPTMHAYYQYVNSVLIHLAVNMRIMPTEIQDKTGTADTGIWDLPPMVTGGQNESTAFGAYGYMPYYLTHEFDILTIINRRKDIRDTHASPSIKRTRNRDVLKVVAEQYAGLAEHDNKVKASDGVTITATDYTTAQQEQTQGEEGWIGGSVEAIISTALGLGQFVGFRIDKTTSASESFSNSSSPPEIASTLKSKSSSGIDKYASMMGGQLGGDDGNIFSSFVQGIADIGTSLYNATIGQTAADLVVAGKGYFDIPDIWKESSFSKSYNFDMKLRSPYGDPISVFTNIYIPCMMILCLALPRSVGRNSYTSPFLVQAYCKGQFAIPCGIIESVSINRGGSEHGWTYNWLPTKLELSFSIKDLSPVLHISISSGVIDIISQIFAPNSTLQEYLLTLAGTGLAERRGSKLLNIKRKMKIAMKIFRSRWLNPQFYASLIGNSSIPVIAATISPWTSLPSN